MMTNTARNRNGKSWNFSLCAEGIRGPLNQRNDFIEALQICKRLYDEPLEMETNLSLLDNKSGNGLIDILKASKKTITDLNLEQDADSVLPAGRRIHLRHHTGNQAATGSQLGAGIRGKHHPWTEQ